MLSSAEFIKIFKKPGQENHNDQATNAAHDEFTSSPYGSISKNVNEAHFELFQKKACPRPGHEPFKKMQAFDGATLPANQSSFTLHAQRANHVAYEWLL